MKFFTENFRFVLPLRVPSKSTLGKLTSQPQLPFQRIFGIPLGFAMLLLWNQLGFCSPEDGEGCSAAATATATPGLHGVIP